MFIENVNGDAKVVVRMRPWTNVAKPFVKISVCKKVFTKYYYTLLRHISKKLRPFVLIANIHL